jgi:hypothetical protein
LDDIHILPGALRRVSGLFCVIASIIAPILPIPRALDSLAVTILQQNEKSQKDGKFIVCL